MNTQLTQGETVWPSPLIRKYDVPGPRYTSYPTAVQFKDSFGPVEYERYLRERPPSIAPLSLYVHIPFCHNICYYCACNKIVTRSAEAGEKYLAAVETEIGRLAGHFDRRRQVTQLHWGGGTPTFLNNAELTRLMHDLACHFTLIDSPQREYSIEIDPRTVDDDTIALLKGLGFNRISLGIQDFDTLVQEAVNRIQPFDAVKSLVASIRNHRFSSLSFDLIYGLPRQSVASMSRTLTQVLSLSPDRIACYSYAHLPEMFKTQRSIDRMQIPSAEEKLGIQEQIVSRLTAAGYRHIGMDHFVKPEDELARAMDKGSLQRNFQGYSTLLAPDLVGIGVSAISSTDDLYCQNARSLDAYYALLDEGRLPVERGLRASREDRLRREVIMQLICRLELDIEAIEKRFELEFATHFAAELERLATMESEGLVAFHDRRLVVTPTGRSLIRNICMVFDAYLDPARKQFSRTI